MSNPFTVVQYSSTRSRFIASIHRTGCRDILRDEMENGGPADLQTNTVQEGLDTMLADDLGWTEDDIKVLPCCNLELRHPGIPA